METIKDPFLYGKEVFLRADLITALEPSMRKLVDLDLIQEDADTVRNLWSRLLIVGSHQRRIGGDLGTLMRNPVIRKQLNCSNRKLLIAETSFTTTRRGEDL